MFGNVTGLTHKNKGRGRGVKGFKVNNKVYFKTFIFEEEKKMKIK